MQRPVGVSNGSWLEKEAIRRVWLHGFGSWKLHHAVNIYMCNVYFLQQRIDKGLQTELLSSCMNCRQNCCAFADKPGFATTGKTAGTAA